MVKTRVEEKSMDKKEEVEGKKESKSVLVAIRMDRNDRLLLNWALVKVADPGDSVLVLHVCRRGSEIYSEEDHPFLDGYLDVYKGLCNVKQLHLIGKVCRGGSIRKVIVREAKLCDASVAVVGINRLNAFGGWLSTARYCTKRLLPSTTVLAVHKGKVVYRHGFYDHPPGLMRDWRLTVYPIPSLNIRESQSSLSPSEASEVENYSPPPMVESFEAGSLHTSNFDNRQENISLVREDREDVTSSGIAEVAKELLEPKTQVGWPLLNRPTSAIIETMKEPEELLESKPGWPLLRATSGLIETMRESEARKMSVVNWVMSLPTRTPSHTAQTQLDSASDKTDSPSETEDAYCEKKNLKRHFSAWGELPKELELQVITDSSSCKWFNHEDLRNATSEFSSENLIGSGGCSRVYKGYLPDGKTVAVKILKVSKEAWRDFVLEVDIMSSLKHKHITPLVGVCLDENELILIYDFLSNGSLEETLHAKKKKSSLSWEVRFNVAVGIADAINYLHKRSSQPVIHRDIKSSNILLSDDLNPQLSDFGLAIWAPTSSSHETHSDVVGTFGYLAPEYFMYGKVSEKIDVYSFGVVLLELLSGRKPISTETPKGQESLVMWAKPILESGDIKSILDPDLDGNFDEVQMRRMVLAVTLCITRKPRLRPDMDQILELLRGEKDTEEWMASHVNDPGVSDYEDGDEAYPDSCAESHLGVALLDVEDTTTSFSSVEQSNHHTFGDYLKERWSRSSSFD